MCGIAGGWFRNSSDQVVRRINEAIELMRYRGPDQFGYEQFKIAEGVFCLGHTRLSIIDLSDAGRQPMHTPDGRFCLVFNGEIYNYQELKNELKNIGYTFLSDSDTEVLLTAWLHWGRDSIHRLVGMFAFAVLDKFKKSLTCVRDAFGIKPLFYACDEGSFYFASQIDALKKLKGRTAELDWQQSYNYLVHANYDIDERTFFRDVFNLLPGHVLEINLVSRGISIERWWQPTISQTSNITFKEAAEILREMFLENIRLHLRSDVPLGAALSGGLDSSAVVCAMRHIEPHATINTFSYIAKGHSISEEAWVDFINKRIDAKSHKVSVSSEDLISDLDNLIAAQGEPFGSTSIYAQYRVFKLAKDNGITVTLDGQGADELLAGYIGYPGQRLHSLINQMRFFDAISFLNNWGKWPGRTRIGGATRLIGELTNGAFNKALRHLSGRLESPKWINSGVLKDAGVEVSLPRTFATSNANGRRLIAKLADALTRCGLPALLRHGDRNSMRFSIESRVPFLTTRLADFLLSLPEEYLVSQTGETKSVFRAAMRGIVPDEILDRKDKIGFAAPDQNLLIGMAGTFRSWLSENMGIPFFNQTEVLRLFDLIVNRKKPFNLQVWRWVNFARWYRNVFL